MSANICLECRKGADECCFMARLAPVDGWEAHKVRYRVQGGRCSATYSVKACPNFEAAPVRRKEKRSTASQDGAFTAKMRKTILRCYYGASHFCDGTPNRSEGGKVQRQPCKFFKCGRCTNECMHQ